MSGDRTGSGGANRWVQLWLGVLCMVLIANLQYAWTLFVNPMHQVHGWSIAGDPGSLQHLHRHGDVAHAD